MAKEKTQNQTPEVTPEGQKKVDSIVKSSLKVHEKIWLLHEMLLTNKQIMEIMAKNAGHVGNVLKDYSLQPDKIQKTKVKAKEAGII